jgi:hypothetical protein
VDDKTAIASSHQSLRQGIRVCRQLCHSPGIAIIHFIG